MSYQFETTCVEATSEEVHAFEESAEDIEAHEFREAVGEKTYEQLENMNGVPFEKDWAIRFKKGVFRGKPSVMMDHSRIFHFYTKS